MAVVGVTARGNRKLRFLERDNAARFRATNGQGHMKLRRPRDARIFPMRLRRFAGNAVYASGARRFIAPGLMARRMWSRRGRGSMVHLRLRPRRPALIGMLLSPNILGHVASPLPCQTPHHIFGMSVAAHRLARQLQIRHLTARKDTTRCEWSIRSSHPHRHRAAQAVREGWHPWASMLAPGRLHPLDPYRLQSGRRASQTYSHQPTAYR